MKYKKLTLLFCLFSIFSVVLAATLNINALNGSSIFVNGSMDEIVSNNSVELELNNGTYTIKVSKQGYTDYVETIQLSDDQNYILNVEQIPLTRLVFDNEFPISVSYNYQNQTIANELDVNGSIQIPSSIKEIEVNSNGYQNKIIQLNLLPFDEKVIKLDLLKENYFVLTTNPSNAQVFVNNKLLGQTPLEINSEDVKQISVKKEGYITKRILYNGEKSLNVNLIEGVNLAIESVPSGAAVYNGEEFLGVTPLTSTVEEGIYDLKITYMGYNTKNINIEVEENAFNNYRVVLEKEMNKIDLFNTENVELNIDGNYLGSGIDMIFLDDSEHLMKVKNSDKIYSVILSKNVGEHIDFQKDTFINVISGESKTFNINSKTYNTPTTIKLNLLAETQYFTLNTVNKSHNLKLNSGNGYNIFLDSSSAFLYSSNVKDTNFYLDGKLILDEKIIPINKKSFKIETRYENKISNEEFSIKENEAIVKNYNLDITYPVRIDASNTFMINNKTYNQSPYYVYLKSGANVIEYNGIKAVVFIYGPEYVNLDSIF
jgi:hypothetical protein